MINVTDRATEKIRQQLACRGYGLGIRIGIRTTGCSGLAYVLEYVDQPQPTDHCIEIDDCKIFIDPKHATYVAGMNVDYVRQGLNEGFEFSNPNEKARCGCGESFQV